MKLSFATTALTYASANAFAINGDGVHCRSGPGTDSAIVKSYNKGQDVTLTCQAPGTSINGDTLWDKTTDGCFVADYYVQTGTSNYVAAHCPGGGGAPPGGDCEAPASNQATVDLIAEFEGFVDHVYTDATGHPTVGYGHLCHDSTCSDVGFSIPLSVADGKKLLAKDMAKFESCITMMTANPVTLNLNQYGALVSWSFNEGCGAAESSTLIKRLNNGEDPNTVIAQELPQWVYGGSKVLPGLVRRRKAEVALAQTATADKALPAKC